MSAQNHSGLDKKWISFGILMLGAGTIYKLGFLKDAFYVPMQEFMGLSHTQIGTAMSVAGLISTFGFLASIYLTDRISKKIMIPLALIGICLCGLWLSTFPSYPIFLLIYCLLAVCADMLYWPTMLKTVRLLGTKEEQGRMFGIMEAGRGLVDTVIAFCALGIFSALGSTAFGLRASCSTLSSPASSASSCISFWNRTNRKRLPMLMAKNSVPTRKPGKVPCKLLKTRTSGSYHSTSSSFTAFTAALPTSSPS